MSDYTAQMMMMVIPRSAMMALPTMQVHSGVPGYAGSFMRDELAAVPL